MIYVEMELLARERQESMLREAAEGRLARNLAGRIPKTARTRRHLPLGRLRQR